MECQEEVDETSTITMLNASIAISLVFVVILAIVVGSGALFAPFEKKELWCDHGGSMVATLIEIQGNRYRVRIAGCLGTMGEEEGNFVRHGDQLTLYPRRSEGAARYGFASMRFIHDAGRDYLIDDRDLTQIMDYETYGLSRVDSN